MEKEVEVATSNSVTQTIRHWTSLLRASPGFHFVDTNNESINTMDVLIPDEEVRLIKAVAFHRGERGVSVTEAAREFAIPYSKLQRRLDGAKARRMNGSHNKHFTPMQEKTLTDWLD